MCRECLKKQDLEQLINALAKRKILCPWKFITPISNQMKKSIIDFSHHDVMRGKSDVT